MNIVEYKTKNGKEVYIIKTEDGVIIKPILKFIMNKSNSNNCTKDITKIYCEYLKMYLEVLKKQNRDIDTSTVDDLKLLEEEMLKSREVTNINLRRKNTLVKRPLDFEEALCTIFSFHSVISNSKGKCSKFEIKL